jgi:hypothetical protein
MNPRLLKRPQLLLQHPNRLAVRRRSFLQLLRRSKSNRRSSVFDRRRRSASGRRSWLVLRKRRG